MSYLPNTGMNLSTPVYVVVGLVMTVVGFIKTRKHSA